MVCLWSPKSVGIVLLLVTCISLAKVKGHKDQTRSQWPVKDSRKGVDLDSVYDVALHLQQKLLKEFKHLKNQMALLQADHQHDEPLEQSDDTLRHLDTLDLFGKSQTQLLRSKLEEHDAYLKMLTEMFKDQLGSIAQRIEDSLETQEEQLKRIESRMDALNDTLVLDHLVHHDEVDAARKKSDQLIKGIFDSVVAPRDCADVRASGRNTSGVYRVFPGNVAKRVEAEVFCDMDLDGNGWLIFQQRKTGNVSFERNWNDYANGFGDFADDFWLGNDLLHVLTSNRNYRLRVELKDFDGQKRFAEYGNFSIRSASDKYRLLVSSYTGDAGDSLLTHSGAQFSTVDADHDMHGGNCAKTFHGAWWYKACHASNLNGQYLSGNHSSFADGINWQTFRGYHHSMNTTRMMIAPVSS